MTDGVTAFGPGRVNLIGEHTDYNGGLALPFAIEQGVTVHATPAEPGRIEVYALDLDGHDSFELEHPEPAPGWRAFARGAAAELQAAGCRLVPAQLEITGDVPRGSGLSSSAALEVALCLALLGLAQAPAPEPLELARICARVENEWVGAQTGLLDQLASLCGERDRALAIDFGSLQITQVALELGDYTLVTVDSGQRHANAGDDGGEGYNQRRAECARACELLGVTTLSEASAEAAAALPAPLAGRARHVLSENQRVRRAVAALGAGDLEAVGALLNESHASLRDDYQVSTPAVEQTVARLRAQGAIGARIIGGGFGGHVLGLLGPDSAVPDDARVVTPGPGAGLAP